MIFPSLSAGFSIARIPSIIPITPGIPVQQNKRYMIPKPVLFTKNL